MWPVSAAWLPALTRSHAITVRVEAWLGDAMQGAVDIEGGTVTATGRNRVRRTLSLTVPESLYPSDDGLLNPYGTELRVWRGIDYGSSREEVPVFRGPIITADDGSRYDGRCEVSASDLAAVVNQARFERPRAAPAGSATTAEIAHLIAEAVPGASVAINVATDGSIAAGLLWDRDRGQAIDDLAVSIGADVWAGPDGSWHLGNPATLDQPAVWTLTDGEDGTIISDQRTVSRENVYNIVIVVREGADGTSPSYITVEDDNPSSPTWVGGPFGRVPRFYRTPLITSEQQARAAGAVLLARSIGLTRTRQVTCVPNPALEIGDRIDVFVGGELERHVVEAFTLPLGTSSPAMSVTTRSVKPDPGDIEG